MHVCKQCVLTVPLYEVKIEGVNNAEVLRSIKPFIKLKEMEYNEHTYTCLVKETQMQDFYDFCTDHLDIGSMYYRMEHEHQVEWQSFKDIVAVLELSWIDKIISEERIVCWSQPIVDSDKNIYAHEVLARFLGEGGRIISPATVFNGAKKRNRLYALDKMCRMQAIQHAVYLPKKVFINFIPTSIYSPVHCLKSAMALTTKLGFSSTKFVFEVVESEQIEDVAHLRHILQYYREKGFDYALDDVGEGSNTIEVLKDIQPQYMKLDKSYVQGIVTSSSKQEEALGFLTTAVEVGAVPLAEGIECEEDFLWLKEAGFKLFQGYWLGKPQPIRQ